MVSLLKNYVKDSVRELHKVTWPTKNQSIRITIIVLSFCAASAALLLLFDLGFSEAIKYFVS